MYKHILESAGNINWMAILPLTFFFLFFSITIIRVMRKNKKDIDEMARLPLEETNISNHQNELSHEK